MDLKNKTSNLIASWGLLFWVAAIIAPISRLEGKILGRFFDTNILRNDKHLSIDRVERGSQLHYGVSFDKVEKVKDIQLNGKICKLHGRSSDAVSVLEVSKSEMYLVGKDGSIIYQIPTKDVTSNPSFSAGDRIEKLASTSSISTCDTMKDVIKDRVRSYNDEIKSLVESISNLKNVIAVDKATATNADLRLSGGMQRLFRYQGKNGIDKKIEKLEAIIAKKEQRIDEIKSHLTEVSTLLSDIKSTSTREDVTRTYIAVSKAMDTFDNQRVEKGVERDLKLESRVYATKSDMKNKFANKFVSSKWSVDKNENVSSRAKEIKAFLEKVDLVENAEKRIESLKSKLDVIKEEQKDTLEKREDKKIEIEDKTNELAITKEQIKDTKKEIFRERGSLLNPLLSREERSNIKDSIESNNDKLEKLQEKEETLTNDIAKAEKELKECNVELKEHDKLEVKIDKTNKSIGKIENSEGEDFVSYRMENAYKADDVQKISNYVDRIDKNFTNVISKHASIEAYRTYTKIYGSDVDTRCEMVHKGYGDLLVDDRDARVRVEVAKEGIALNKLVKDDSPDVRAEVAKRGYGLEELVHDDFTSVRIEVAKHGIGLATLVKDESPAVRLEVAKRGYGLDKLVKDESSAVRMEVARHGYGLDVLSKDKDTRIALLASTSLSDILRTDPDLSEHPNAIISEKNNDDIDVAAASDIDNQQITTPTPDPADIMKDQENIEVDLENALIDPNQNSTDLPDKQAPVTSDIEEQPTEEAETPQIDIESDTVDVSEPNELNGDTTPEETTVDVPSTEETDKYDVTIDDTENQITTIEELFEAEQETVSDADEPGIVDVFDPLDNSVGEVEVNDEEPGGIVDADDSIYNNDVDVVDVVDFDDFQEGQYEEVPMEDYEYFFASSDDGVAEQISEEVEAFEDEAMNELDEKATNDSVEVAEQPQVETPSVENNDQDNDNVDKDDDSTDSALENLNQAFDDDDDDFIMRQDEEE